MDQRQELITMAVIYVAGRNSNMPGQARRILADKFGVSVCEVEVESACAKLAGDAVLRLAQLAQKAK